MAMEYTIEPLFFFKSFDFILNELQPDKQQPGWARENKVGRVQEDGQMAFPIHL